MATSIAAFTKVIALLAKLLDVERAHSAKSDYKREYSNESAIDFPERPDGSPGAEGGRPSHFARTHHSATTIQSQWRGSKADSCEKLTFSSQQDTVITQRWACVSKFRFNGINIVGPCISSACIADDICRREKRQSIKSPPVAGP